MLLYSLHVPKHSTKSNAFREVISLNASGFLCKNNPNRPKSKWKRNERKKHLKRIWNEGDKVHTINDLAECQIDAALHFSPFFLIMAFRCLQRLTANVTESFITSFPFVCCYCLHWRAFQLVFPNELRIRIKKSLNASKLMKGWRA